MCGIAGFIRYPTGFTKEEGLSLTNQMAAALLHRGPDGGGCWGDEKSGVFLAHRRLAIVDLSAAGKQPMHSASERYVMVYNGEVYNHLALRKELENGEMAPAWRGHSDSETLLAGFDAWGVETTITRAIGMFAIALWDRQETTLTLIRDRLGEKPLYYGWQGDTFMFASDLKALKLHPNFRAEIDRNALTLLMRHSYIPAPYSIYQGISKLLPGSQLTLSRQDYNVQPRHYWAARQIVTAGLTNPFSGSPGEAVEALHELLRSSVAQQMVADVPLGAFLSGGVDSSTIVALMQAQSSRPVRTFTIGFNEEAYNEAKYASAVAHHIGTDHTELYVSPQQALDVIPRLADIYSEPFADSSQIPTFLISHLTRQHVTVSLSGDGGDELFGGYNNYVLGQRLWRSLSILPRGLRQVLARLISGMSPQAWNHLFKLIQGLLPVSLAQANIGDKLHKSAMVMPFKTPVDLYRMLVSGWQRPDMLVKGGTEPFTVLTDSNLQPKSDNFFHQMMALDLLMYLPDDILAKVDRAAMSVGLETRVPLLDHRITEFAWRLPLSCKLYDGAGKWPLRQVLYKYVPKELIERPKAGFAIPLALWLRGPLREWADDLLDKSLLCQAGYFNPAPIRQKWTEHLSGVHNWQNQIWTVLMFQAWLRAQ